MNSPQPGSESIASTPRGPRLTMNPRPGSRGPYNQLLCVGVVRAAAGRITRAVDEPAAGIFPMAGACPFCPSPGQPHPAGETTYGAWNIDRFAAKLWGSEPRARPGTET